MGCLFGSSSVVLAAAGWWGSAGSGWGGQPGAVAGTSPLHLFSSQLAVGVKKYLDIKAVFVKGFDTTWHIELQVVFYASFFLFENKRSSLLVVNKQEQKNLSSYTFKS